MNPELQAALDEVKAHVKPYHQKIDALENRVAQAEEMAGSAAEQVGCLIVGGSSGPPKSPGENDAEYRNFARAFMSQVQRREVAESEIDWQALKDYSNAFDMWIRRGDALGNQYKAAMSVGSDPSGGFWVPPEMSRTILSRLFETSPMRQIASQLTIGAHSIELPLDSNDIVHGGWIGEQEARPETATPDVGMQEIFLREGYALPVVTQRLLDMSTFNVAEWLVQKIVEKFRRVENTAFISGSGVTSPRGFLDYKDTAVTTDDSSRAWGVLQYVATGSSGGFPKVSGSSADDPDSLITLKSKLKPDYLPNARWMMNRATAAVVRKLKDADGRYLWADSIQQGQPDMLLGHGVVLGEDLPDIAANSFSIAFGDFSAGYLILDHTAGIRILRDSLTTKGKTGFYSYRYAGGDCRDFDAIKLLKFGTS